MASTGKQNHPAQGLQVAFHLEALLSNAGFPMQFSTQFYNSPVLLSWDVRSYFCLSTCIHYKLMTKDKERPLFLDSQRELRERE